MSRNIVVMWDFRFVFVTIICTCADTASMKHLSREKNAAVAFATEHRCGPESSRITLTPRPTMTAKEPLLLEQKHQLLVSLVCRATLQLDEMEHQMPSFRMNSLCSAWRGNALPSAASFCIQYGGLTKSISGRHRAARAKPTSASGLRTAAHGRFECDGLIFAFFGFATACSALEGPVTSLATKLANSTWDSGQPCNVELWALVVSEGPTSIRNMFLRCRRGKQCLQFLSNSARLASVGRIRSGSSSLLICSTSEASAVELVRE